MGDRIADDKDRQDIGHLKLEQFSKWKSILLEELFRADRHSLIDMHFRQASDSAREMWPSWGRMPLTLCIL